MMKGLVVISPLILALAACGSIAAGGGMQVPSSTPTPAAAVATPTPVPTPTPPAAYSVGDTVTTTTNASYTVTAVGKVNDTGEFAETPSAAGGYFFGADVKICAGTEQELADPIDWAVIMADDTQYEGDAILLQPSQGPALQSETVQPGACTAGWVYFDLPGSPAAARIELEDSDWYWTLGS
jgi:hypothetical protein